MNFDKIKAIDLHISRKSTGSPKAFALKINISKGMLYRYINYMKNDLNAPIVYNKNRETFEYTAAGQLCIKGWISPTANHTNHTNHISESTITNKYQNI